MLIACDFDGTVTAVDTNDFLSRRFSPRVHEVVESKLLTGELSLREVLAAELGAITVGLEQVVEAAVEGIPLRKGFPTFVHAALGGGAEFVLLSSGFRQLIEPLLARAQLDVGLRLIANDIAFDDTGGHVTWRQLPPCALCNQHCKRWDVGQLRAEHPGRELVYIGDGFSDRCGADVADRIFARAGLARYLDERGIAYTAFEDFDEITASLIP